MDKAYLFPYLSLVPYGNSKLANMYFIKELTRRLVGTGVNTYCVCPGLVNGTDIMNGQSWWKKFGASLLLAVGGFTPEQVMLNIRKLSFTLLSMNIKSILFTGLSNNVDLCYVKIYCK